MTVFFLLFGLTVYKEPFREPIFCQPAQPDIISIKTIQTYFKLQPYSYDHGHWLQ